MKIPYDKAKQYCKFGHFDKNKKASYTLTGADKLICPWYYVYQNRKILLYVDQNGPVKMQYEPPSGILVAKRELGETESKWQVWVSSDKLNGGVPVSNFGSPKLNCNMKKPEFTVNWTPSVATYTTKYDNVDIITEIVVPHDKATVVMKTTVLNKSREDMDFCVTPAVFPYVNIPQMVAWDLPEWYLRTTTYKVGKTVTMHGQMSSPEMDKSKERSVTFNFDYDENGEFELDMSKFVGTGNFFSPDSVKCGYKLSYSMEESESRNAFGGQRGVWAARYKFSLAAGEKRTLTQVMTVQDSRAYSAEENLYEQKYFDEKEYSKILEAASSFYDELFQIRKIHTANELYNNFINNFAPLQMYWVASLDRGWPSSMRGTRDASQDFTGMLPLDPDWTRELIISLLEHQRKSDGWFPRQVSTISRQAPHDMRYFCDSGAFLLELIHEYLAFTRDTSILDERVWWLETDEKSTVLEHVLSCVNFYINGGAIGEHGLCKVWYGDWWDVMDKIGMEGRGETVTVTAQMIYNLKNLADMFKWLVDTGRLDKSYLELADSYLSVRDGFIKSMRNEAYNKLGYFNGYFNDNGKWLLSDCDPDGEDRLYLVSNAWALISGAATGKMKKSVLENIEKRNFGRMGYNSSSKGFPVYIDKAGRVGNGNSPRSNPYNHAQSFLVRAACAAGDSELAYKATRYILPIEEEYAPPEMTYAAPFCIANAYSNGDKTLHRVQLQYLSGTVSYVLRNVYSYFFGITYDYDGLVLKPCLPKEFGECSAEFSYLGNKFTLKCYPADEKKTVVNGKLWSKTKYCEEYEKDVCFIPDRDMQKENLIEIYY